MAISFAIALLVMVGSVYVPKSLKIFPLDPERERVEEIEERARSAKKDAAAKQEDDQRPDLEAREPGQGQEPRPEREPGQELGQEQEQMLEQRETLLEGRGIMDLQT